MKQSRIAHGLAILSSSVFAVVVLAALTIPGPENGMEHNKQASLHQIDPNSAEERRVLANGHATPSALTEMPDANRGLSGIPGAGRTDASPSSESPGATVLAGAGQSADRIRLTKTTKPRMK